jgi:hypothetical protein
VTEGAKPGPTTWFSAGRDKSGTFELPRSALVSFLLDFISEGERKAFSSMKVDPMMKVHVGNALYHVLSVERQVNGDV